MPEIRFINKWCCRVNFSLGDFFSFLHKTFSRLARQNLSDERKWHVEKRQCEKGFYDNSTCKLHVILSSEGLESDNDKCLWLRHATPSFQMNFKTTTTMMATVPGN